MRVDKEFNDVHFHIDEEYESCKMMSRDNTRKRGRKVIENGNGLLLSRFTENKWADKFIAGEVSFSCPGKFIYQNKITGNEEQGDSLEAVFARLKRDDRRIDEAKKKLGKDLEIFLDKNTGGEFIYLRRRSAKLVPIFCIYAYTAGDLLAENIEKIENTGWQFLPHEFDGRMYGGFSNTYKFNNVMTKDFLFTQLVINTKAFVDRVRFAMWENQLAFKMGRVEYIDIENEEFYIEPTKEYRELFYKRKKYDYQYEGRVIITNKKFNHINERYGLKTKSYEEGFNVWKSHVPMSIKLNVDVELKNN